MLFTVAPADFPTADGWVLKYTVSGPSKAQATASPSNGVHSFSLSATDTAALTAGTYRWTITATLSGQRFSVAFGTVNVIADVPTAAAGTLQSQAERELAALNAEILARASSDHTEYSIDGKSLKREPIETLLAWRDRVQAKLNRRRRGGSLGMVDVHFPARNGGG